MEAAAVSSDRRPADGNALTARQLNTVLAAAHRELTRCIRSTTDSAAPLLALMAARERSSTRSKVMDLLSVGPGHSPDGGSALISARANACELARQLCITSADLDILCQAMSRDCLLLLPRERSVHTTAQVRAIAAAEFALVLADMLSDALSALPPVGTQGFLQEADRYVAREISAALKVIRSLDQPPPEHTATDAPQPCRSAVLRFGTASDFLGLVLRARLSDVSDMDLADISFTDVNMLVGLNWSDGTSWPPYLSIWVHDHSITIRPGHYRIHCGCAWSWSMPISRSLKTDRGRRWLGSGQISSGAMYADPIQSAAAELEASLSRADPF